MNVRHGVGPLPYGTPAYVVDTICGQRYTDAVAIVHLHPAFVVQYELLCQDEEQLEVAGEVTELVEALRQFGHEIEGEAADDVSHRVYTSSFRMFALRRTPPTVHTPYAEGPPVLRIPYVWFVDDQNGEEVCVVMFIGDKTGLGNTWYPKAIAKVEGELIPSWTRAHPKHRPLRRRP